MSLPTLLTSLFLGAPTADAAPRKQQMHVQVQTGVLSRETVRVEEVDLAERTTMAGPGAGGVGMAFGYHLKAPSEIGARAEFSRVTVDDGITDQRQGNVRFAGYYSHYFQIQGALQATATGILGLERKDFDGDALAKAPFLGAGGGIHWFATPRTSLNAGLELTQTMWGRFEQDGIEGSSRYNTFDLALVGGVNVYLGGKKTRRARRN